jgi:DNA-binding response OmpR family regulator
MKRILIVDDEPGINLTLKMGLEEDGFHVDTFDDPNVPLDNLRKGVYDTQSWILKYQRSWFS